MTSRRFLLAWLVTLSGAVIELTHIAPVAADPPQPIEVIEDNSFLIEEAYNQDAGVVQHIFTAQWGENRDEHPHEHGWNLNFTQEWPIFSERHQFSYSLPFTFIRSGGAHQDGIGDIFLNYRLQVLEESQRLPAFAPRFSLIVPTGSRDKGTGNGVVGYQWNLPFSKILAPRLAMHVNLGLTYLPGVRVPIEPEFPSFQSLSKSHSLLSYNLGASAIVALFPRFHLMLEWIGIFEEGLNDQGKKEHDFNAVISPGVRAAVVNRDELQIVLGIAAPIGLTRPAQDHAVFLYFSVEHNFL
jgi:hypothetical protein